MFQLFCSELYALALLPLDQVTEGMEHIFTRSTANDGAASPCIKCCCNLRIWRVQKGRAWAEMTGRECSGPKCPGSKCPPFPLNTRLTMPTRDSYCFSPPEGAVPQDTQASSECPQSWLPRALAEQSVRRDSDPLHSTLSSQIWDPAAPAPK